MLESLAELTKSFLVPGTLTFLLFALTLGLMVAYGPRRTRRFGLPMIALLAMCYWLAAIPAFADLLGTRFHARDAKPLTLEQFTNAKAIVVLGAGIRASYTAGGLSYAVPDGQTIYNAAEAARLYRLIPGGLPIIASGGGQDGAGPGAIESSILQEWLIRAGVPANRIILESRSKTTRQQAQIVAPMLKERHWERFVLVTPPVQGPRAATVFTLEGTDPISAPAPFWPDGAQGTRGWSPNSGALRVSERSTYDYLAWGYYWMRGWLH